MSCNLNDRSSNRDCSLTIWGKILAEKAFLGIEGPCPQRRDGDDRRVSDVNPRPDSLSEFVGESSAAACDRVTKTNMLVCSMASDSVGKAPPLCVGR
jgi:hypothetical protein